MRRSTAPGTMRGVMNTQGDWADLGSCRLRYECAGDGPPLMFVHGYGLDRRMWDAEFERLARRYTVVRHDCRGFGESTGKLDDHYTHGGDLLALMDHLGLERALLTGLSMGTQTVLEVAVTHPERVAGLVLPGPWLADYPFSKDYQEMWLLLARQAQDYGLEEAKDMWRESMLYNLEERSPEAGRRLREIMDSWSGWHLEHLAHFPYTRVSERLGEVSVPTLVVLGSLDLPDFKGVAERIADRVPGARCEVLEGVGHLPNMEGPEEFAACVDGFLAGVE